MRRNKFSLSHYKLLTCDMGQLIPLTWYEALPGDTIQQSTSALVRMSPLLAPVMHPVRIRIHHWFVPNRLIWDDWEDFITGGPDGTSTPEFPHRFQEAVVKSSIYDHMGVPLGTYDPFLEFSALPFRAYNLIYNEHYRDQDIIPEVLIDTTSGRDFDTEMAVQKVAWEKDFFTTARPWEQKGEDIILPIGDKAAVKGIGREDQFFQTGPDEVYETGTTGTVTYESSQLIDNADNMRTRIQEDPDNALHPGIYADLSEATGITVNDLRLALALQRYREARAQYGSRYVEYLRYLGVRSSDARLQNPEYLGGGRQVIQFSEVLQTGPDPQGGAETYVGDMKGHGIAAMRTNRYRRFIEEHGIVMTLMSVVPKSIYTNGLPKMWFRQTKEDYFQKELQFIGEQEVLYQEVNAGNTNRDETFGYQNRYDEYRWLQSDIAGDFNNILNYWHLAREFSGDVALNQSFIDCTPSKRIHADIEGNSMYIMANHSVQARRMLSKYAKSKTF